MEESVNDDDRAALFIRLLAEHERRLAAYVMTFVSSASDADDILQETKIWLWRSFDQFERGTNFGAWARQAAFYRIQQFIRKRGTEGKRLVFSDTCLEQLADAFEKNVESREERVERLSDCVSRLSPKHRQILTLRYGEELAVDEIAGRINRTVAATYRVLSRVRLSLRDCVLGGGEDFVATSEVAQ
ncbi:sigma-70 family RNA polymerase sigma factor [Roseiconus lacunae]|uniref:sigma-70 family RNA polymerase sigma factor n=1 Tax=Roseiconus lacunae TaxID=2605694 RepID=UPI001E567320|nr:sigma-70 family RNA polymerase sigma factor [Roseiconus lacunae]MCD0463042.1 sigma-70 family RNA polymerase sigma factor [Roseiconus lacunae]